MELSGYERIASFGTAAEAEVVRGLPGASGIDARAHIRATMGAPT